jgi:hypothetical protein
MFSNPTAVSRSGAALPRGRVIPATSGVAAAVYGSAPFAMPAPRSSVDAFSGGGCRVRKPLSGQPGRASKPLSGKPTSSSANGSNSLSSQYHARKYKEQQQRLRARRGAVV